jgi:ParB-like chromosome segregation protein Spo0J
MRLNGDQAKARTTVPGPLADIAEIAGHHAAILYANRASVCADALALIEATIKKMITYGRGIWPAKLRKLSSGLSAHKRAWMTLLSLCLIGCSEPEPVTSPSPRI